MKNPEAENAASGNLFLEVIKTMKESKKKCEACSICGEVYEEDRLKELDGKRICPECFSRETIVCSHCGDRIWSVDNSGTLSMPLCSNCYDDHYTSCIECGRIIHREDAYYEDGEDEPLCYRCYEDNREHEYIEDYYYKPEPIFYGISDEDIANDNAHVFIDKELARATKEAIEMLGEKDIYHIFTPLMPNTSTRIILKKPKTDSSIRKVWLPKTVAYILREWKRAQDELREFLGNEYQDFNLVVALPNGRPCENRIIEKEFLNLKQKAGLPNVVFHSLRHSSTTYKLKLNHGDLKATQGDTGHAEIDMITKVYAHILDEDRKINAQKFESAFYANPDLRNVKPPQEETPAPTIDLNALIEQLQNSPELANTLASIIAQKAC